MSMNKYISGIIHCLDTVPSLKKALVKAFKGVDVALADVTKPIEHTVTTTYTKDSNYYNYCKEINGVIYLEINLTSVTATANTDVIASIPSGLNSKSIVQDIYAGGFNAIRLDDTGNIYIAGSNVSNASVRINMVFVKG